MATLFLIIIYTTFIGLGIPDSLFGTAWPAIYTEFGLPISYANNVTLLISGCTVLSSLFSAKIISHFGTGKVTAISTTMTAAALLGFSHSSNMLWLCAFAIPLGLGAGAIDSGLNNYVALHYKAMHMNFLHCFYGIGVALSPYFMSIALSNESSWRGGYQLVFYFQLGIAIITILSLPLWSKMNKTPLIKEHTTPRTISITQLLKKRSVRITGLIFIGSCAIEYTCGIWGSTFLVQSKGMSTQKAALMITLYYGGMALGRFLSGVLTNKLTSWQLIKAGQGITLVAIVLLFLPLSSSVAGIGLFLIGIGNSPVYPNMIHLTPSHFGKELSQAVMGVQIATSFIGIMFMPPLFGMIAQYISVGLLPTYLLLLFTVMIGATLLLKRRLKKEQIA